ncbi:PAS domain S-box protein [Novispirillum itersonii]|uniref:Sensor protein FixL n=1 Tax=Novispirillum itersonii TaxID=189 RepID=A0A7W9ZH59_NOVIT|nr:PAS domain S-box protein [Novispirillum itersonii]MBB6211160.1 PAS domain S-box-containing protein [Novispirillum itersonii]
MLFDRFFVLDRTTQPFLHGVYTLPLVVLSVAVAVLAGGMAMHLAGMARAETRRRYRQMFLLSGAFVLGSGVWSMHFVGMLAYSLCQSATYHPVITALSALPSFLASWVALALLARTRITPGQLIISGILMGAGIGTMHYSGMAAVYESLDLRFDLPVFLLSIVVAVGLSVLALWVRFGLDRRTQRSDTTINLLSGIVMGTAISGMHYTGMAAARFLDNPQYHPDTTTNFGLAFAIAGTTVLAILITGALNMVLRYRSLYKRMAQNEARLRTIIDTAVDGIIIINSRGTVSAFNTAAEQIFGWQAAEVIGRNIAMLMPEPQHSEHDGYLQRHLETGEAKIIGVGREVTGLRRNGETFPLRLAIGRAVLDEETVFVGFITDISRRRAMEEALRTSERQHRSLISNLPGVAFRCRPDADWSMLFISDAVETLTGWPVADFLTNSITFARLMHPEDQDRTTATVTRALEAGEPYRVEYRIIDRAGREHWVSENASGVRDENGTVEWIDGIIIDITDIKRRNAEFEGVVKAISRSLAVVEFDLSGIIIHANSNFLRLTGYALPDLIGSHHSLLCTREEVTAPAYRLLWDTLRQGRYSSGEFHRIGKDGRDIWIYGSYNPVLDPDGRPYKIIKFATDLTERHAMEQDLRDAKARAEQAAAAKSTFLANMSHEIRTPMNAIIGFTDVLLGDPVTDTQRRHLNTVRTSARSLLGLLNDILDTAKLERGAVDLEIKDFSLRDVCMQVLASLRVNAQTKGLPLILEYPDDQPEFFRGDALRIQQVLLNLVGNAVKFTERGEVRVLFRHTPGQPVRLTVSDTGIGIAPDRVARIFDPFAQADASMTRRFGGTGLGTTIARQLVELMGGRISVESELGLGSRFHIDLPLPAGEAVDPMQDQAAVDLPPLALLVADDVPQNLELLHLLLSRQGHTLTAATNGEEAVQAFSTGTFDLVLMDVQMPVLNGLDATRQIRALEAATGRPHTPVIALTASVLEEDVTAAQDAGMDGFATKPVDLYALTLEMARLLRIEVSNTRPAPAAAHPVAVRGSVIDWAQGKRLWGSEDRHRTAIRRFLDEYGHTVPHLRTLSADPAGLVDLAAQIHRLRGAAANLALSRVSGLSAAIESSVKDGDTAGLPARLDQLADELLHVEETLGQYAPAPVAETGGAVPAEVDAAQVLSQLDRLDQALARSELDESLLAELSAALPKAALTPLDDAINSFDFDAARQVIATLRTRYGKDAP